MAQEKKQTPKPPRMNPYVFTVLLLGLGLWCFYDGFLTTDPEMLEHAMFNKVLSGVLLPWAVWDFFKVRRHYKTKDKEDKT